MSEEAQFARGVLSSGKFEELIGTRETLDLEYKFKLWDITREDGKFEFAKDIAAMANSTVGLFIVGVQTATLQSTREDVVVGFELSEIRPRQSQKLREVIADLIYPSLIVSITIKPYHRDQSRGFLVLELEPGIEGSRPYVVVKSPCGTQDKKGVRQLSDRYFLFPRREENGETTFPSKLIADWARQSRSKLEGEQQTPAMGEAEEDLHEPK